MLHLVLCAATVFATVADPKRVELTNNDVVDIVVGVAEGFFIGDKKIANLKPCVQSFDEMKDDVVEAVALFEKQKKADMVKGFTKLAKALEVVPQALKRCDVDPGEVAEIIDAIRQIKDITSFAYEIGRHLIINGVDILNDIAGAMQAFKEKKYESFGVKIGDALRKLLLGATSSTMSKEDVAHLIMGVTEGFFLGEKVSISLPCIHAGVDLEKNITFAVSLLERQTANAVLRGIKLLSNTLHAVPDALNRCDAAEKQVEKVIKALHTLKSASDFAFTAGKNILINGAEIYHETASAEDYWRSKNYAHCGIEMGLILRKVLIGDRTKPNTVKFDEHNALDVILGVARGFFFGKDTDITEECVSDTEEFYHDAAEAVMLFNRGRTADIRKGLTLLANSLKIVKDALKQCKAQVQHIEKITMAIATLSNPSQFAFKIGVYLIVNSADIYHMLLAAVADWDTQEYAEFGVQVGLILSDILVDVKLSHVETASSEVEMISSPMNTAIIA